MATLRKATSDLGRTPDFVPERSPTELVSDFRLDAGASRKLASTRTGSYSGSAHSRHSV
jgi:hypothetical protein